MSCQDTKAHTSCFLVKPH